MSIGLYETDFYRWTVEQAQLLELRQFDDLDLVNLADEIGSLGREEARSLERHFAELIGNLLKWEYASQWRNKIWQFNITSKRREIKRLLQDSPSLNEQVDELFQESYESALNVAMMDNMFESVDLPKDCPYSVTQVLDDNFPVGMIDFPLPYDRYVLTFEEFLALPETKPASEYFNGRISQKPMPNIHHSVLQGGLTSLINQKGKGDRLASVFLELDFVMSDAMMVPDISVFASDHILVDENGHISNDLIKVPPDWLIEILSSEQSVTLLIDKIKLAILHGTKLAWLVDPMEDVILTFTANGFNSHQGGDILPVLEIFKDWQLSVQDVFNLLKLK